MLKWIIAALFLGSTLHCFSNEDSNIFEGVDLSNEHPAFMYISLGSERVLAQDFIKALEHFTVAAEVARNSEIPLPDAGFFIHFGQAITYDNLGLKDECRQALGSMMLTLYAIEEGSGSEHPGFAYDEDTLDGDTSPWSFMRKMASLAATPEIRILLLDLIDHLAKL